MFGFPPYPALPSGLAEDFARSESFSLRSRSALRCRTLGQTRPRLAGLVPLMGKASVSNITVSSRSRPGLVVVPKALGMAYLSVVASPFAILPPPPSRFRPLAPYCPISWHLTAKTPPPTATLLLPSGLYPTATHRLAPYCSSWLAGIPSARWLRSPTCLSPSCDLLYGRNPRLGYGSSWYCTASLVSPKRRRVAIFRSLPTMKPPPQPDFTVRVLVFGILAIVVISRRFFDSFLSVTWGPAEGFGSLSCTFL